MPLSCVEQRTKFGPRFDLREYRNHWVSAKAQPVAGVTATRSRPPCARLAAPALEGQPFKDLTVDELARAAGLSRTAFYFYFPGKSRL